ncbi:hypothetical protein FHR92_001467 [Fontibacillus solani]|uniref:Uncharacterized protein n=1 Tax=Fontibacillus solani TaxID=1572857 RepID=A0A7W3SRN3_9BACL|nr:hypothetical protein [Fontibacillus solani]MBA9085005.1 hypothetical protein [Fontibacillus solani]
MLDNEAKPANMQECLAETAEPIPKPAKVQEFQGFTAVTSD